MPSRLADWVEPGGHVTSGLILEYDGRYVFGIEPRFQWNRTGERWTLHYIGIGGHQDPGETWMETVIREAQEEARCRIELMDAGQTCECLSDGRLRPLDLVWEEPVRPWLLWRDRFRLPDRRGPGEVEIPFLGLVFRARAVSTPAPGAEIPALIGLSADQVADTWVRPVGLDRLLAEGARLWEASPIPRDVVLRPLGTARFFAAWLARRGKDGQDDLGRLP